MKKPCTNCPFNPSDCTMFTAGCEKRKKYNEWRKSQRKYEKGEPIKSLEELLACEFVMFYHKTTHIEVIKSFQLRAVLKYISNGGLCHAIKK